jgi:hypothetical protein
MISPLWRGAGRKAGLQGGAKPSCGAGEAMAAVERIPRSDAAGSGSPASPPGSGRGVAGHGATSNSLSANGAAVQTSQAAQARMLDPEGPPVKGPSGAGAQATAIRPDVRGQAPQSNLLTAVQEWLVQWQARVTPPHASDAKYQTL